MPIKKDDPPEDFREIDRFEDGVGWIAHPDEGMQRASHALAADGDVWVVDPVDAPGIDDLLAEFGDVAGVVVGLDRHKRDADALADRHDVPVYLHRHLSEVADALSAPTETYDEGLPGTDYRAIPVADNRLWTEVALFDPEGGTLVVPEAVGTVSYFRAGDERLGVHPMLRPVPPRKQLGDLAPERILVGHGAGVTDDATRALDDALRGARRRAPRAYAGALRAMLPV